jgi:hypothetical protein
MKFQVVPIATAMALSIAACLSTAITAPAQTITNASLLDFDDLVGTTGGVRMPTNYGGLSWTFNAWYYMRSANAPTNTYLALGGANTAIFMPGGQDFYFDGADYWSRRGADANGSFYFYMMRDNVVVYDGREDNDGRQRFTGVQQTFTPNYTGLVDYVAVVFTQGGDDWDHLAMDNLRIRTGASSVPVMRPSLQLQRQPDGFAIQFNGTPGQLYTIEASTNLTSSSWSVLGIVSADETGLLQYFDANTNLVQRCYRAVIP